MSTPTGKFEWSTLGWGLAVAVVAFVGTWWVHNTAYDSDLEVRAGWPERVGWHVEGQLRVKVEREGGAAVPGAQVELGYVPGEDSEQAVVDGLEGRGEFVSLGTTEANDEGVAWVEVPAAESFVQVEAEREARGSSEQTEGKPWVTLALRATAGMDATQGYRKYPMPESVRLALSTDRPLYQPGQRVRMRGMIFEAETGRPVDEGGSKGGAAAQLEVRGPRGNVLYRERPLVSAHGVVSGSFELAAEGQSGTYEATLSYEGVERTRPIEVRPYAKPRFEVQMQAERGELGAGGSGEVISGEVSAEFVYGEPVADGEVELRLFGLESLGGDGLGDDGDGQGAARARVGTLDESGRFDFEFVGVGPGRDSAGGPLVVKATVTDASGRVQTAEKRLGGAEESLQVEFLPVERTRFRAGERNEAVILVSGADREPVEGATVQVGSAGEALETNARGRAELSWMPAGEASGEGDRGGLGALAEPSRVVEVRVETPRGQRVTRRVPVSVAPEYGVLVQPGTSAPRVGESLDFELKLSDEGGESLLGAPIDVVALNGGIVVGRSEVTIPDRASVETGPKAVGLMELGPEARGLTHLVVLDRWSRPAGWTTLWVRQAGGSTVAIRGPERAPRPGEETTLTLGFPAESTAAGSGLVDGPAIYGVWAVDEALYALKERTDVPLETLLWEQAGTAQAAGRALAAVERAGGGPAAEFDSELGARLARDAGLTDRVRLEGARSVDREIAEAKKRRWMLGWLALLGLALTALALWSVWHTIRNFRFREFSWMPIALALLAPLPLSGGVAFGFDVFGFDDEAFVLLVLATAVLMLVGATVQATRREPELGFMKWAGAVVMRVGLLVAVAVTWEELPYRWDLPDVWETVLGYGGLGVLGSMVLEVLAWAMIFRSRERWAAMVGTVSLDVGAAASILLLGFMTFGATAKSAKFQAASAGVDRFVSFGEGSGGSMGSMEMRRYRARPPEGRGGEAGGSEGLRVRDHFPDTMLWMPEIKGGEGGRGEAEVSFRVPDSITTWRIHAVAHTEGGRLGEGTARMEVRQPIFAQLDLPGAMTAGDRIDVPVTVVDGRKEPDYALWLDLAAEADGALRLADDVRPGLSVPPGGRKVVYVPVEATGSGRGSLTVRVTPSDVSSMKLPYEGDAVRRQVEVQADGLEQRLARSAVIGEGWRPRLSIPESAIEGTARARLEVLPGMTAVALEGIDSMLAKPHGCFEQTSSIAYPNLMVLQALEQSGPEGWSEGAEAWRQVRERAEGLVHQGYQKILGFQHENGGFSLYGPSRGARSYGSQVRLDLTAYGLLQLADIDRIVDGIDAERAMRAAAEWLAVSQDSGGAWSRGGYRPNGMPAEVFRLQNTALVVWALGRAEARLEEPKGEARDDGSGAGSGATSLDEALDAGLAAIDRLSGSIEGERAYERALAANAMVAAGRESRAREVLGQLGEMARRKDGRVFWQSDAPGWMGGRGRYADVTTTALVVRAMAAVEEHPQLVSGALQYLVQAREPGGGWGTTQATVWAIDAMTGLGDGGDRNKPVRLEVTLDGEPMERPGAKPAGRSRFIPGRSAVQSFRADGLGPGERQFEVASEHSTGAIGQVTLRYRIPWNSMSSRHDMAPFRLELEVDSRRLETGGGTDVTATVENVSGSRAGSTVVRLPIPPGGWADDARLQKMAEKGAIDRIERQPTHLVVYLPKVSAGESVELPYRVVARMSGNYHLPPVSAFRYYNPRPEVVREGGELQVGR